MNRHVLHAACLFTFLLGVCLLPAIGRADAKDPDKKPAAKTPGVASGLLIDSKNDFVLVQVDGDDEPTKFLYGPGITQQALMKQNIFSVDRVNLKYKVEGDDKKVTAVEKVTGRASGVIIGKVLKVYNDFWVAVKPTNGGAIEGFALNGPADKVKAAADTLKSLSPGDLVAIKYATDFERHRILQIEVKPSPAK